MLQCITFALLLLLTWVRYFKPVSDVTCSANELDVMLQLLDTPDPLVLNSCYSYERIWKASSGRAAVVKESVHQMKALLDNPEIPFVLRPLLQRGFSVVDIATAYVGRPSEVYGDFGWIELIMKLKPMAPYVH